MATAQQIAQLQAAKEQNSKAWFGADKATQDKLHNDNLGITQQLADLQNQTRSYNADSGTYAYTPKAPQVQAPSAPDYSSQVNAIYDQQKAARLAELRGARDKAVGDINLQKQQTTPMYYAKRNEADATMAQNVQRLRESMANAGLTATGENVTAQVGQNAARQNVLGSLNQQEQQTMDDFNKRITDLNNPAQEQALISAIEAERARALYQAQQDSIHNAMSEAGLTGTYNGQQTMAALNADRSFGLQQGGLTGIYNGQATLQKQNMDWGQQMDKSQLTGMYNGNPTLQRMLQEAGLTGYYNGSPTFSREQFNSDNAFKQQQLAQQAANAAMRSSGGGSSGGGSGGVGAGSGMSAAQIKELQADSGAMLGKLQSGELSVEKAIETINAARTIYGDAYANGLNSVLNQYTNNQVSKVRTSDSNELAKRGRSGGGSQSNYQSYVTPEAADLASRYLGQ